MFGWFKKEDKTNKEIAIEKFKKAGLTFEEADYLAQDVAKLSLYGDNKLFSNEEDNVHSIEDAYKDKYFMDTVDTIIKDTLPIKEIASTGMKARAMGLAFEERMSLKNAVLNYLEKNNLDNSHYKEVFIQALESGDSEEEPSALIQLLYTQGWIDDMDNEQHIAITQQMIDTMGEEQALSQFKTIFEECELWYSQVNNPVTPLQETTSLALNFGKGKLEEIKYNILHEKMLPLDILLNTSNLKEPIKQAIENAIENESFPEIEDEYKDEVAARFVQYMQEEVRLSIVNKKENNNENLEKEDLESQIAIAIQRSMVDNQERVWLHADLDEVVEWFRKDGWKEINNNVFIYPEAIENGKYKKVELAYDENNFSILRASLVLEDELMKQKLKTLFFDKEHDGLVVIDIYLKYLIFHFTNVENKTYSDRYELMDKNNVFYNEQLGYLTLLDNNQILEETLKGQKRYSNILRTENYL